MAETPRGMGDYDPPDDEPEVTRCECCEETGYLHDTVESGGGRVCSGCRKDYDQCVSGESPECWQGWVRKDELTYVAHPHGWDEAATCPACMAEGDYFHGTIMP
jgi:hypothetical protein